jgi:hypothetical protein
VPTPAIVPTDLEALASVLAGMPLGPGQPAHLVHIVLPGREGGARPLDPDDELDLGVARLAPGAHPLEALVGTTAPAEWAALGVVTAGTVRDSADPSLVDTRIQSAHLVERGGGWAAAFGPLGGSGTTDTSSGPDGPDAPCGRVDDALRLALGLATPPAAGDTLELFTVQWLDRLVGEAAQLRARDRHRCSEAWAISRHPAVEALSLRAEAHLIDVDRLVAEAGRLATWRDWPQLRRMCAAGTWEHPELTAEDAAWLDDGAFARWAVAAWPDLPWLADVAASLLPPATARAVHRALAAWEVLPLDGLEQHENV